MDQVRQRVAWFSDWNRVFDLDLSKHALLVRLYLARCSNNDGQAFPSLTTIAAKCKMGRSSVAEALNELEEKNLILREQRNKPDNPKEKSSTLYTLLEPVQNTDYPSPEYGLPLVQNTDYPSPEGGRKEDLVIKTNILPLNKKKTYAEFVTMTEDEYNKLVAAHGEDITKKSIELLDNYKGANGKKYKSDYRAILQWVVGEVKKRNPEPVVTQSRYTDLSIYD